MTESESAPVCQTCGKSMQYDGGHHPPPGSAYEPPCADCADHPFVPERAGDDEARDHDFADCEGVAEFGDGDCPQHPTKTADEWLATPRWAGVKVLDADGWDRARFADSWAERITEDEFNRRLMQSTCQMPPEYLRPPAPSGDEPVTSPDLDAARDFAERVGWRGDEVRAFIAGAVYREAISAPERAAAAERERGLRAALQRYGRHESPACARVVQERCPCGLDYALAVSSEGEGQ